VSYSPKLAAALSGATLRQLAHWRNAKSGRGAVLVPELSAARPILYSFRDVVALRACVKLRNEASLQRIRRALETLRDDLHEREHLSTYQLVADGLAGGFLTCFTRANTSWSIPKSAAGCR
jgi:hypothetical protein